MKAAMYQRMLPNLKNRWFIKIPASTFTHILTMRCQIKAGLIGVMNTLLCFCFLTEIFIIET